jgi:hypothetical protein
VTKPTNVYIATQNEKILGIFSNPHLASGSIAVNSGYGVKSVETSWGWVLTTHTGIVQVREFPLDPK